MACSFDILSYMTKSVAFQKCSSYNEAAVYNACKKLLELVPPPDVTGKTVLLKPNILSPKKPEAAVCTNPIVVGVCVKLFLELGASKVIVGESPATANSTNAARITGMLQQVEKNGGSWVDFNGQTIVPCPNGKLVKTLEFAAPFTQADIVVSLSKLKSHQLMAYTGAMKNLFGLVVGLKKAQTHYRFSDKRDFAAFLTDLNIAAAPDYALMDAIVGMEGPGGPGNGDPVQLNFLAASDNILALDWMCAKAVGYNPNQILNLKDSMERGIWLLSPDEITTLGCDYKEIECKDFKIVKDSSTAINLQKMLPSWLNSLAKLVFIKTPHFNKQKCKTCGKCIEICPAHILEFSINENDEKCVTMLDKSKCLHCFCCHEICPVEAIVLKRF